MEPEAGATPSIYRAAPRAVLPITRPKGSFSETEPPSQGVSLYGVMGWNLPVEFSEVVDMPIVILIFAIF